MQQLGETEQRSGGHRYGEFGVSDIEAADLIGGFDVS